MLEKFCDRTNYPQCTEMTEPMTENSPASEAPPPDTSSMTLEQVFQRGLQAHKSNQFDLAKADYLKVLSQQPDHFGATYLLGLLCHQTDQHQAAHDHLSKALELDPTFTEAHANLGSVLKALDRFEDAIKSYQKALELDPEIPETHYNLGLALSKAGKTEDAITSYLMAIRLKPDYASAHNNLGNAWHTQGRLDEALEAYETVLKLDPSHRNAHFNCASIRAKKNDLVAAEESYLKALELDPGHIESLSNLGNIYVATGQHEKALTLFDRALALEPRSAAILSNKGEAHLGTGQTRDAMACFRSALEHDPTHTGAHSNLLFAMSYDAETSPADIRTEAENWNRMQAYGEAFKHSSGNHQHQLPLRVGFVSADFNAHPVSDFLCNILPELNPDIVSLYAYSNSFKQDQMTARLKPAFAGWRDVAARDDHQLANDIQRDRIDILFDLSGHTSGNRLRMFTLKPAPVQVSWLGYGGTTGLSTMDYVLCDAHVIPPENEIHFTEHPWRLPDIWVCFSPPALDIAVNPLPALTNGFITFGSFNSLAKVTDETVSSWARVLKAVPDSRLFLKAIQLGDAALQKETRDRFARQGIDPDRLTLKGRTASKADHLADYKNVDIALDPFPYAGGTTSVEAFWMGVPVLTRRGNRFVSNMSVSLSQAVNLTEWIANSEQDYIEKACHLAADLSSLATIRMSLREQLVKGPLCDAVRFARNFELALQSMWDRQCDAQATR